MVSFAALYLQAARSGEQHGDAQMWATSPTRTPTCRWYFTSLRTASHSSLCRCVVQQTHLCHAAQASCSRLQQGKKAISIDHDQGVELVVIDP